MQFGQLLPTFFLAAYLQAQLVSNGPPFSHGTFSRVLDGNEGNMEEIGEAARLGKCLGEGQVECHFVGFPQGRNYSRGIGDAWHPSKTQVGSCYNHKTSSEICKKKP